MKIEKIKINAFGKLENKEIEFGNFINIIHGENESGKTSLLKFISSIFYGASKNKKGNISGIGNFDIKFKKIDSMNNNIKYELKYKKNKNKWWNDEKY